MVTSTINYTAAATITISPASLASSATFVAGREATAISNSSNLFVDALLSGAITVGTTPTINTQIEVWVIAALNETPTWPDVMDGTDSAETWTSVGVRNGAARRIAVLDVDATTSNVAHEFSGISIAEAFGGTMPDDWTIWVTHNTGVALNATGGNHSMEYIGIKYDSA